MNPEINKIILLCFKINNPDLMITLYLSKNTLNFLTHHYNEIINGPISFVSIFFYLWCLRLNCNLQPKLGRRLIRGIYQTGMLLYYYCYTLINLKIIAIANNLSFDKSYWATVKLIVNTYNFFTSWFLSLLSTNALILIYHFFIPQLF